MTRKELDPRKPHRVYGLGYASTKTVVWLVVVSVILLILAFGFHI